MVLQHSKWFEDSLRQAWAVFPAGRHRRKSDRVGLATTQDSDLYFRLRQIGTVALR
jgi:hypothetical protein